MLFFLEAKVHGKVEKADPYGMTSKKKLVTEHTNRGIALIWSDPVKVLMVVGVFVFRDQGQPQPKQSRRRLISLIFAGRNRMVMIRRELPRTKSASPAKPVA